MEIKVKKSGAIRLVAHKDPIRGDLFVAEADRNVPFPIKRAYFINVGEKSAIRGNHAHKKTTQIIFCISGSFVLELDDGECKQKIVLNEPEMGIVLGPKLWHTMSYFSKNCLILVLADDYYNEEDYIRNYEDFLELLKNNG